MLCTLPVKLSKIEFFRSNGLQTLQKCVPLSFPHSSHCTVWFVSKCNLLFFQGRDRTSVEHVEFSIAKVTAWRVTSSTNMMASCLTISRRKGTGLRAEWATCSMWCPTSSIPPVHPQWSLPRVSVKVRATFHRAPHPSRSTPLFCCPRARCFLLNPCCLLKACHNCLPK